MREMRSYDKRIISKEEQTWLLDWGKIKSTGKSKKLKFDYTKKCYMYKPESLLENETYEIL